MSHARARVYAQAGDATRIFDFALNVIPRREGEEFAGGDIQSGWPHTVREHPVERSTHVRDLGAVGARSSVRRTE